MSRPFKRLGGFADQEERLLNSRAASRLQLRRNASEAEVEHRSGGAQLLTFVPRQRRPVDTQSPRERGLGLLPPGGDEEFALGGGKRDQGHVATIAHCCYNSTSEVYRRTGYHSGLEDVWREPINS